MNIVNYIPIKALMNAVNFTIADNIPVARKGMLCIDPMPISVGTSDDVSTAGFFPLQYNPESISVRGAANYAEHNAKGIRKFVEYVNTELDAYSLDITIVNDVSLYYDSGKELSVSASLNGEESTVHKDIVYPTIRDLLYMFKLLVVPDINTGRPPDIRVSFGDWFLFRGVATSYEIDVIKTYVNLEPKIANVRLDLIGDYSVY
jgi:hypothetical protein